MLGRGLDSLARFLPPISCQFFLVGIPPQLIRFRTARGTFIPPAQIPGIVN